MIDMRAEKSSTDRPRVRLDFSKLRHGSKLPPILLERDGNLCHHHVEGGQVPPSVVAEALIKVGGKPSKAELAKYLMDKADCGKSTAYSAIDKAVEAGVISASGRVKKSFYSLKQD